MKDAAIMWKDEIILQFLTSILKLRCIFNLSFKNVKELSKTNNFQGFS